MKFTVIIGSAPRHPTTQAAFDFCQALVRNQQSIAAIYLLGAGVQNAAVNKAIWSTLAQRDISLFCCVASAQKYQLANASGQPATHVHPDIRLSGLSQLIITSRESDKVITFGQRSDSA